MTPLTIVHAGGERVLTAYRVSNVHQRYASRPDLHRGTGNIVMYGDHGAEPESFAVEAWVEHPEGLPKAYGLAMFIVAESEAASVVASHWGMALVDGLLAYRVAVAGLAVRLTLEFAQSEPMRGMTPADTPSTALWLDASDASTITHSAGLVDEWRDKAVSAYHASPYVAGERPVTGARSIGGLNAVDFAGAQRLILGEQYETTLARDVARLTILTVAQPDRLSHTEPESLFSVTSGSTVAVSFRANVGVNEGNNPNRMYAYGAPADDDLDRYDRFGTRAHDAQPHVLVYDAEYTEARWTLMMDGSLDAVHAAVGYVPGRTTDTNAMRVAIGAWANPPHLDGAFDGAIGEVVVLRDAAGWEIAALAAGLMEKWGS